MSTDSSCSIRRLTEDDLDALYRIRQIAFQDNVSWRNTEVQKVHEASLPYKWGRFDDGELVSSASWYPFEMYLHGEATTVGGLASVVSAAASRRRGHVRALLAHGLETLRDDGVAWCLEYPFDTRYYRRFGWETVSNGFFFELPVERFARFDSPPAIERVELEGESLEQIGDIYAKWAANYNFTMARDEGVRDDWTRILEGPPWLENSPRFVFAMKRAYVVIKLERDGDSEHLTVLDYAFSTPAGRLDIFGFMNHFAGQVDTVRLQLPADDPLVMEWTNFIVAHPHPLHARVVDVASALSGLKADEGLAFNVAVRDDFCAWNAGVFRVSVDGGVTHAEAVDAPAELSVDVRALAQMLSGSVTASAAMRTGLAHGGAHVAQALCRLAGRGCYMPLSDYF
ncbi:GNAT family N-acetyltransferase [Persicimonas caeni]|uniref:GNAT family N-acetyltransferase n=1 Tax=Persicimonas caeni TaxID=2292766 RepID=A0A4Y6PMG0_PERCE|nr:GNAT family N-acetyltransferase [Persicimonas caeni]QDG49409.1 GNAT family N-acetyltransferase [Persicimonas caeni]QED30630.1 GNAT family N-acetyltransferase [Persicimonas caeni]